MTLTAIAKAGLVCVVTLGTLEQSAAPDDPSPDAIALLRGVENTRSLSKPFRLEGIMTRTHAGSDWNCRFTVECQDNKYRIVRDGEPAAVAISDGERLFGYDGHDSATIIVPGDRASFFLAFDPRSLGISTGLYSDLTLRENIAYHSAADIRMVVPASQDSTETDDVIVELTDRFDQRIQFQIEPRSPFRVSYYSKTILEEDSDDVFAVYVTESEYWPDEDEIWIPKRLVMYSLANGDPEMRHDEIVVEFQRPEFVTDFDSETWSFSGLSMPIGQPVVDLSLSQRLGYWDGNGLVNDPPATPAVLNGAPAPASRPWHTNWLVLANLAALGVIVLVVLLRHRAS